MSRSIASAKAAGTWLEVEVAEYLAGALDLDITREVKHGSKDRGDIHGVVGPQGRFVVECKNTTRMDLPGWWREANVEALNAGAGLAVVVHKRHGSRNPGEQWVTCDLRTFAAMVRMAQ